MRKINAKGHIKNKDQRIDNIGEYDYEKLQFHVT